MIANYRGLAIEGGGVLGIAYIGALEEFIKRGGSLEQFTHFAGTSAGSILAGLLAIRAELSQMKKIMQDLNFNNFLDDTYGVLRDLNRMISEYGWYRGDVLRDWYRALLNELTGIQDITFAQVHERYGTYVVITCTEVCLPYSKLIRMDLYSHPNKPLYEAVHESACMPLFFAACIDAPGGSIHVDGGVLLNYPIKLLYDYLEPHQVLGLYLVGDNELAESRPVKNLKEFILSLLSTIRERSISADLKLDDWEHTVSISSGHLSSTDFSLTDEDKKFLMRSGRATMKKFIS